MIAIRSSEIRPLPSRGPSLGTRLILLAICSILLMVLDRREHHLASIRWGLSIAAYPLRVLVDLPFSVSKWLGETLATREQLLADNRRLGIESLANAARLQRLAALEAENAWLRALLDSAEQVADRVLVAEILRVDMDPYRHRIALNRGGNAEVYVGQTLLDAHGIVGQVTRIDPFSAEAILITDPEHAVPIQVNRNGLRTIAVGTGDPGQLSLPFLTNNADIEEGDLLVTSGLGGTFPAGYPVGRVEAVRRRPGEPFAEVFARPAAALNRHREVLLVWPGLPAPPPPETATDGAP